jgi:V/A-type H+-transporting ATPase subunit I
MLELPSTAAAPNKAMAELEAQLEVVNGKLNKIQNETSKLAKKWGVEIWYWTELLEIRKERLDACSNFGYSESAVLMEGWVPEKSVAGLEKMLGRTTKGRHIFHAADAPKEEAESAPTKLENPPLIKDFEFITEMYGSPSPTEVDPTPFLAITFPLFFGICLGDVGYGVLLSAVMISGFWIGGAFPRNVRRMLVISGVTAIVFGLLTGSFFGPNIPALWVNPVNDPVTILKLAVFIGVLQLFIAFALVKALKDIFRRAWKRVFLEDIARALVIIGFFGLGFCILGMGLRTFGVDFTFPKMGLAEAFNPIAPASTVVVIFRGMFYVGILAGVVGAITLSKGARSKFSGTINVFYGVIGLIADAASYSRLMALGISSTVIAFLLNNILSIAFDGMVRPNLVLSPALILAGVVMVGIAFIFIAGHCFNLFLASMGGFIHTLRLHFAEFFGKFYEGSGEKFAPFKAKRVFTEVKGGE